MALTISGFNMTGNLTAVHITPPPVPPSDTYFKYNSLLLPGTGNNGAQNNTFLDGSTNNFTITRNGNTTQGTFSPYGDKWSNYFDGTGDYLATPTGQTALTLGTNNFTIELWCFPTTQVRGNPSLFCSDPAVDLLNAILVQFTSNGQTVLWVNNTNLTSSSSNNYMVLNQWNHVAVCRSGASAPYTYSMYINGVAVNNVATNSVSITTNSWLIGTWSVADNAYTGYISNFRIVKGTALYSGSTITPSTAPLTAISGTQLLACQSNRFIDNSTNNFTITRNGNVSVQRFSPFNPSAAYNSSTIGGSGYFDGTGDRLSSPANTAIDLSTADFTIDCWVYPTSFSSLRAIITYQNGDASNPNYGYWLYIKTTGVVRFENFSGASQVGFDSTIAMNLNTWNHIAVTRTGTSGKIYINGVGLSGTLSSTFNTPSGAILNIGDNYGASFGSSQPYLGYMTDLRIVKGTLVYTENFTPPTAPITAITNTSLLLNYTNAGIIDNAMMNNLETVGNVQISTAVSKFGAGSMSFDGAGDGLYRPPTPNLDFGTENFTIEWWMYFNNKSGYQTIASYGYSPAVNNGWLVQTNIDDGKVVFYKHSGGTVALASDTGSTVNTGEWYHIAVVRNSGTTTIYRNGTSVGSGADTTNYVASTANFYVGGGSGSGFNNFYFNGYIDDLRITKGIARYTSNFTAPTAALETQ